MMASKGWKVVQAHIPMIKFRKGGNRASTEVTAATSTVSGPSARSNSKGATGPGVIVLPTIEDYQIPVRYQRRRIDEKEIAYINRGGPE